MAGSNLRPILLSDGTRTLVDEVDYNRATFDEIMFGMVCWRDNGDGTHSHVPRWQWPDELVALEPRGASP